MVELRQTGLWIQGEEVPADDGDTFPVLDPGRGEEIGKAARGKSSDVDRAIDSANQALKSTAWKSLTPLQRGRMLTSLAQKIEDEKDHLARILSLENGKPLRQAYDEVHTTMRNFEYFAGWADKIHGRVIPVPDDVFDYILHEPLGVVAHIIPWNYPLDILARGVAPCLAIGNTVVVKPDEKTPFGAIEIARMATEVGFPPGVINIVTGFGSEAGAPMAAHPDIQALAFCGSVATGSEVLIAAAKNITPVISLELGGKSPNIIFQDADIERAVVSAAWGICYNTGQSCGARSRLLVPLDLYPEVIEKIRNTMGTIRLGHGLDDPDMGPIISEDQLEIVLGYIHEGMNEGAELAYGGQRPDEDNLRKGYFIEPTLFTDVHPEMRVAQEEIFGPVLCVLAFETEQEAVELANASQYGLSGEIWTRDIARAHRVAAQLDVTHVTVNGTGGFGIETPFGGLKKSGFGREGGWEAILQYSRVKNVWISLSD